MQQFKKESDDSNSENKTSQLLVKGILNYDEGEE